MKQLIGIGRWIYLKKIFVPFSIEPANQEDVILNLDLPSFKYIFEDNRGSKEVSKEDLLDVLSTGEKRAYYILNLIFQILVAQKDGREKLVILDDISESFDYKNKHAIIEYISDIAEYTSSQGEKVFKVILLTHNFDFTEQLLHVLLNGEIHILHILMEER